MTIYAVAKGIKKELEIVEDEAFSQKMLGDGLAITPEEGCVYAPCDATVTMIFPTNHAIGLTLENNAEVLIHIGIDTVELNGGTFVSKLKMGDVVKKGDLLVEFDLNLVKSLKFNTDIMVTITNGSNYSIKKTKYEILGLNDILMEVTSGDEIQNYKSFE